MEEQKLTEQGPQWEDVEPEVWKPENEGDEIEGVLINKETEVGVNESNLYQLETKEGIKSVWGSTVLDQRMKLVNIGDHLKIIYKGMTLNQRKQNTKIFKIARKIN